MAQTPSNCQQASQLSYKCLPTSKIWQLHICGCGFFAYSWKLPAYSGAFLLTVDHFSIFTYNWSFFAYNFSFFAYNWSLFCLQWKSASNKGLKGL